MCSVFVLNLPPPLFSLFSLPVVSEEGERKRKKEWDETERNIMEI